MKNVYLTSTFTNIWNVKFNPKIGDAIEKKGLTCYLPYRDTDQKGTEMEIFSQDIAGIKDSTIVLAVALNETPNWGAELGYAYGTKKKILVLSDKNHNIPLICKGMVNEVFQVDDLNLIENYIDQLVEKIKKLS